MIKIDQQPSLCNMKIVLVPGLDRTGHIFMDLLKRKGDQRKGDREKGIRGIKF
jgi:hypothetical protein